MSGITIGHWTRLGSAVRDARCERTWSQHELARRAQVSRSWLARVEAGHRGAALEPLLRLFAALELTWTLTGARSSGTEPPPATSAQAPALVLASQLAASMRVAVAARRRASWDEPLVEASPGTASERA